MLHQPLEQFLLVRELMGADAPFISELPCNKLSMSAARDRSINGVDVCGSRVHMHVLNVGHVVGEDIEWVVGTLDNSNEFLVIDYSEIVGRST